MPCQRKRHIHLHPESCRGGPESWEPSRCPPSSADPPRRVPCAPLVPIQQPKARLAAPKYPAQRPGLVGTSQGRLQEPRVEAGMGRCRRQDWFLCLVCKYTAGFAPRGLPGQRQPPSKTRKAQKSKEGLEEKEIRQKMKPRAHPVVWTGREGGEAGPIRSSTQELCRAVKQVMMLAPNPGL